MFGNKEKNTPSASSASYSSTVNSIGQGTFVEGTINADSDIRIDGEIKGNLTCKGRLILGERGKITGDIECQNALIEGEIKGTIVVKEFLQVKDSAIIDGDISTDKLDVDSGAVFNVSCSMGQTMNNVTTSKKSNTTVLKAEEAGLTIQKKKPNIGYLKYSGIAFQMAAYIALGMFIGKYIDDRVGTEKPYFMILLIVLFMVAFFIRLIKSLEKDKL